jgi:hypothetical protein
MQQELAAGAVALCRRDAGLVSSSATQLSRLLTSPPRHPRPIHPLQVRMELIKPAVDWRKAGTKVATMKAAVAK